MTPSYFESEHGTKIAYHKLAGDGPGVVFLGGFMSDMEGSKALALQSWCHDTGRPFIRFDYMGHGQSSGAFDEGTISLWLQDAAAVIEHLTEGPQILVGSSMGGWISLLLGRHLPHRVAALVGIAAAPDFTLRHWEELSPKDQQTVQDEGRLEVYSEYGPDPYVFTRDLFEDGKDNQILNQAYPHGFPMRLIQGTADPDVPWQTALCIAEASTGHDVEVVLVPDGDHRLSEPQDIARLLRVVSEF